MVDSNALQRDAGSDNSPPMKGPMVNPRPNAAPINPILVANCFGVLTSPIYARATAIFPLKTTSIL